MFPLSSRHIATAALTLFSLNVSAQELPTTSTSFKSSTTKGMHLVANAGLSFGGDTLAVLRYNNGGDHKIKAGGLFQIGAGLIYEATDVPFATQFTMNYHVNQSDAKNGTLRFRRYPLEGMVFYTGIENWRMGIGARSVLSPRYTAQVDSRNTQILDFKSTTGAIAELAYAVSPSMWVNVRYVSEKYRANRYAMGPSSVEIGAMPLKPMNGDHVLVGMSFQF